jgi:hypothetical protein
MTATGETFVPQLRLAHTTRTIFLCPKASGAGSAGLAQHRLFRARLLGDLDTTYEPVTQQIGLTLY